MSNVLEGEPVTDKKTRMSNYEAWMELATWVKMPKGKDTLSPALPTADVTQSRGPWLSLPQQSKILFSFQSCGAEDGSPSSSCVTPVSLQAGRAPETTFILLTRAADAVRFQPCAFCCCSPRALQTRCPKARCCISRQTSSSLYLTRAAAHGVDGPLWPLRGIC